MANLEASGDRRQETGDRRQEGLPAIEIDRQMFQGRVDSAYYERVRNKLLEVSNPAEFAAYLEAHKEKLLSTSFSKKRPEEVVKDELRTIATEIVIKLDQGVRDFKKPAEITDLDLAKLEVLRTEHDFDYLKEVRIQFRESFKCKRPSSRPLQDVSAPYQVPLAVYLVQGSEDLTPKQAEIINALIERCESDGQYTSKWLLTSWCNYATRCPSHSSKGGALESHREDYNMLHAMLENCDIETLPFKRELAAKLLDLGLGSSGYSEFVHREEWYADSGNHNCNDSYESCHPYHSAVKGGFLGNVELLAERGVTIPISPSYLRCDHGGNPFAMASYEYVHTGKPAYRDICLALINRARAQEGDQEGALGNMLKGPYNARLTTNGWVRTETSYPIQNFAEAGDMEMVAFLAQHEAGVPIVQAHIYRDSVEHTAGGYHRVVGHETITHGSVPVRRSMIDYGFEVTGHEVVDSIKSCVFNNVRGDRRYFPEQIFDQACDFLIDKGILSTEEVRDLTSPGKLLGFATSMHKVVREVVDHDDEFVKGKATMTLDFANAMRDAYSETNGFEEVYQGREARGVTAW